MDQLKKIISRNLARYRLWMAALIHRRRLQEQQTFPPERPNERLERHQTGDCCIYRCPYCIAGGEG